MNEAARSQIVLGESKSYMWGYLKRTIYCSAVCVLLSGWSLNTQTIQAQEINVQEVEADLKNLSAGQESVVHTITIYDAMARAIKYNRENRLKKMQSALAMEQRDKSYFDFLPELTASAGYSGRNNESASSSESYFTGQESLEASISEDKDRQMSDITLTWSVLDFGLAYVRSKQYSDRYFIAREVERKTVQNIISDVRNEWWNAISAQRLLNKVDPFVQRVEKALEDSRQIESQRLEAPLKALTFQRSLIDMLRTLERLRERLNRSKHRLISLMGMSYGQDFVLADSASHPDVSNLSWDVEIMEEVALISRPELMQARYQDRITREDTHIAILGLIPDINLNAGWNYDTNSYLVHDSWFDYGAQISWNLMDLFKSPATMRTAEAEQAVVKERRMAVAMTVLMQVHFAKANYLQSERQFKVEDIALSVENRILKQIIAASNAQTEGRQTLIREELNQLLAEVRHDNAYAELQNSFGRILVSLGIDTVPENIENMSLEELAGFLSQNMENIENNSLQDSESLHLYLPQNESVSSQDEELVSVIKVVEETEVIDVAEPIAVIETDENTVALEVIEVAEIAKVSEVAEVVEPIAPVEAVEINSSVENTDMTTVESAPQEEPVVEKVETTDQQQNVVFKTESIDIMNSPDRKSGVLARVSAIGKSFPLLDNKEQGWVKLDYFGTVGWVAVDQVEIIGE